MAGPEDGDDTRRVDMREEWGGNDAPRRDEPTTRLGGEERAAPPPRHTAPVEGQPKKRVRGIARSVDIRTDQQQQEKLTFRVDRYDAAGNRLSPVSVEMRRHRGGLVTDGDEVEVVGKWSRGTMRATRIRNVTTSSEVRGWFAGWGKWVLIALSAAIVIAIAVVVVTVLPSDSAGATVPDVVGERRNAAVAALQQANLTPETTTEPSETVPPGRVIRTEPPAEFPVGEQDTVTIVLSSGPAGGAQGEVEPQPGPTGPDPATGPAETGGQTTEAPTTAPSVVVPDVTGDTESVATQELLDLGLIAEIAFEEDATVPAGTVLRADPASGTSVEPGTTVVLVVATGAPTGPTAT